MSHDKTKVSAANSHETFEQAGAADPEVVPKASLRQFTPEYMRREVALPDRRVEIYGQYMRVLLEPNRRHDLGDLIVHTVPTAHGDISASALALVLDSAACG
jgi:hypothetical protein